MNGRVHRIIVILFLLGTTIAGCAAFAAQMAAENDFDSAVRAFEGGNYDAAISHLNAALRRGVDTARIRILLGWSLYKKEKRAEAKAEFERALRMDPNTPNAFYAHEGLGWIAYKEKNYDRALAAFAKSLSIRPGYFNAHTGLGWSYLGKKDLVRAEGNFRAALAKVPNDLDAMRGLGFVAYRQGKWKDAIAQFRKVLSSNEQDTLTRSALAWAYYLDGNYAQAGRIHQEVARSEPAWTDPLLGLAWVAEKEGRTKEAKSKFRAAIEKSAVYVTNEEFPKFRKLLEDRPQWVDLWRDLGWALYHQRAFSPAEAEFRALLKRNPNDADGFRGLGYSLLSLKRYRESISALKRSLTLNAALAPIQEKVFIPEASGLHPIKSNAASTLAWSQYFAGDLPAATQQFRQVTQKHPDWPDPWSGLGWTLLKTGDQAGAERAFRRSLAVNADYPDALNGLKKMGKQAQ